jgi:hypothetical protein
MRHVLFLLSLLFLFSVYGSAQYKNIAIIELQGDVKKGISNGTGYFGATYLTIDDINNERISQVKGSINITSTIDTIKNNFGDAILNGAGQNLSLSFEGRQFKPFVLGLGGYAYLSFASQSFLDTTQSNPIHTLNGTDVSIGAGFSYMLGGAYGKQNDVYLLFNFGVCSRILIGKISKNDVFKQNILSSKENIYPGFELGLQLKFNSILASGAVFIGPANSLGAGITASIAINADIASIPL